MKKLERSQKNRVFLGLFGGLGDYFNADPIIFRLAFLVLMVISGFIPMILIYLLSALIVPKKEETPSKRGGAFWAIILLLILFFSIPFIFILGLLSYRVSNHNVVERVDHLVIREYDMPLEEEIDQFLKEELGFESDAFSRHYLIGSEEGRIFLWAYLKEYLKEDDSLVPKRGISTPAIAHMDNKGDLHFLWLPDSGGMYELSIRGAFPERYQEEIIRFQEERGDVLEEMEREVLEEAEKYFESD